MHLVLKIIIVIKPPYFPKQKEIFIFSKNHHPQFVSFAQNRSEGTAGERDESIQCDDWQSKDNISQALQRFLVTHTTTQSVYPVILSLSSFLYNGLFVMCILQSFDRAEFRQIISINTRRVYVI